VNQDIVRDKGLREVGNIGIQEPATLTTE